MSREKTRKHSLDIGEETAVSLFGIVTSEPVYKIALYMNPLLGISMKSSSPVEAAITDGRKTEFPRFADLSHLPDSWTAIVSNRHDNQFLLKKLRNVDLLLVRYPCETAEGAFTLTNSIREIKGVSAVFEIESGQLDPGTRELLYPLF